jgi:uncharacterized SAM-binding protein YcdF (DUF218 family)
MKNLSILFLVGATAILIAIEVAYRLAEVDTVGNNKLDRCIVLVLGYPTNDDGSLHPLQQMRVETGVSAYRKLECQSLMFSGGAVSSPYIEAETMAAFARQLGVPSRDIIVENRARNTWENIGCSLPYLKNYGSIVIASDILHAKRARRYLCRQKSTLCNHIEIIGNNPSWSLVWWNLPAAAHEIGAWFRDLLLYESGVTNKAPDCNVETSH